MFNKLLANLPFNPSLVDQVSFYAKRVQRESSVRRIGFVFVALAFFVQLFAVLSPPHPSLAASSNDLINNGFGSAAQAANDCRSNLEDYQTILANFGITCDKVASAPTITIHSTDFNRQLFSMGRIPYGLAGETPVSIPGAGTIYARYLWAWDRGGPASSYQALNVTSAGGQTFLLLFSCGNLTSVGLPAPVQKPPVLSITKTTSPGGPVAESNVSPGAALLYRMNFNNAGGQANNVVVTDHQPANTSYGNFIGGGGANSFSFNAATTTGTWTYTTMPAGATGFYVDIKFMVNANVANGTRICNVASLSATGVAPITSNQVCMTIVVNAPPPKPTPPAPPVCQFDSSILQSNKLCVPCAFNSNIIASNALCKPCTSSLSSEDTTACVIFSKTASNTTQNLPDANNTTAQAGDVIKYTLMAKNSGKAKVKKFVVQESISDVLDYADVQDLNGGALDNATKIISWPAADIAAGGTAQETFTVKVKTPIPDTAPSASDPEHFNHIMTNVYGNTINIKLPQTIVTVAQTVQTTLPNTGPGTSIIIGFIGFMIVGYFFARSRLLAKEAVLVRNDYSHNGDIV